MCALTALGHSKPLTTDELLGTALCAGMMKYPGSVSICGKRWLLSALALTCPSAQAAAAAASAEESALAAAKHAALANTSAALAAAVSAAQSFNLVRSMLWPRGIIR